MADNYNNVAGQPVRDPYAADQRYAPSQFAAPPGANYGTYRPPTEPRSPGNPTMQITEYDADRANIHRRRSNSHGRRRRDDSESDEDRYLVAKHRERSRRSSRSSSHRERGERDEKPRHNQAQSIGATLLGGVAGALAGRKAGHKDTLPTVVGALAGAWGGHKLEEEWEDHRAKSRGLERKESQAYRGRSRRGSDESDDRPRARSKSIGARIADRVRSLSRKRVDDKPRERSRSRNRRDDDSESDSDVDDRRRRHRNQRHGSGYYDSETRDRYGDRR